MRSLKFKSFCQVCNKFVEGDYRHAVGGLTATCPSHQVFTQCQVIQFTGLFDKESKEIWEGDLCKHWLNGIWAVGEVIMPGDRWALEYKDYNCSDEEYFKNFAGKLVNWGRVEVLGSIYENPELLKEGK